MAISSWSKFQLLIWKNWRIQWRHKYQMIVEILVPAAFSCLLVIIRSLVIPQNVTEPTLFQPVLIDNLLHLRNVVENPNNTHAIPTDFRLIYSPSTSDFLRQLMISVSTALELNGLPISVDNPWELEQKMQQYPYLAGINFGNHLSNSNEFPIPKNLTYSIRFPGELRTARPQLQNWHTDFLFPRFPSPGPRNGLRHDGGLPSGYRPEGFLAIQHAIASVYLQMQSFQSMPEIAIQRYPFPPFIRDSLLTGLETIVPMIIMMSFVYPCTNTVMFIAKEKEKQLKEAMKIMGLPNWLHWTGWFLRSFIFMIISISIMVALFMIPWYPDTEASVFTHSEWSVLWFFLLIYSIATITFCFMLSVFFSKANTAAAVSGLVFFVFYSPFMFTQISLTSNFPIYVKLLISLFSNTAMAFGFQTLLRYEGTGEGLQWYNMFQPVSVDDSLTLGYVLLMLLLDAIIYLLIALYVEKIFPGDFGVPEPWYFPFTRRFWCGAPLEYIDMEFQPATINPDNYEDDPKGLNAGIQVRELRKIYANKKVAVQSLNLNMYDDQITVLLGHNGAGKTTTMSMLTGMFPPSSGTAVINGKDIRTDIDSVRDSLGLCPQHNILFDELTVREHIVFYSRLKGLDRDEVEQEVNKYVKLINLESKMHAYSKTLSGGMKRKLSVCVAFCGKSKVVLCDEPTSGMDPAARRALWDVLQEEKKGRTVLLSTHFMDEADILGDRIAIMANGELKCSGSSYFLKKKFGIGYHLICVKGQQAKSDDITKLLQKYVPTAQIENDIGTELSYLLPNSSSGMFQGMFQELEDNMDNLGVTSYGVSLTTLEEVFLTVGTDNMATSESDLTLKMAPMEKKSPLGDEFTSDLTLNYTEEMYLLTGGRLIISQMNALFRKKIILTMRNWLSMIIQLLIPVVYVIITVIAERTMQSFQDLPALPISLNSYEDTVNVLEKSPIQVPGSLAARFTEQYEQLIHTFDDTISEITTITSGIEPYIVDLSNQMLSQVNRRYLVGATITNSTTLVAWFNNQPFHSVPLSLGLVHNAVIRSYLGENYTIEVENAPMPFTPESRQQMIQFGGSFGFLLAVNISFAMAFVAPFYVLPYIRERQNRSKLLQFVNGAKVVTFWTTATIWDFFTYLLTVLIMILALAAFQEDGWSTPNDLSRLLLILLVFGFAVLPITYIASTLFNVPADGYCYLILFYMFSGISGFFIVFILDLNDLQDVSTILKWIFLIFPHYALSNSLNNLNVMVQNELWCKLQCDLQPLCTPQLMCMNQPECCETNHFKFEEPGVGRDLTYLAVIGLIAFVYLILSEYRLLSAMIYSIKTRCSKEFIPEIDGSMDGDVLQEHNRVIGIVGRGDELQTTSLVVKDMSKRYTKFTAVKQLSFAVDQSECFGLLGVNGAGKTSTFKMLTGDTKISYGEAWVRGNSVKLQMNQVHQIMGYCPQFDALIEDFTGRETLSMFCALRGVPRRNIPMISISLAEDLNFIRHIDKKVKEYSGGNKRKLSTAVALIGNPAVVYLDEPTTGMDPGAKRKLWNMICKIRQAGKSIILTSHSMDECEALCTRLAVMVNGEFKCLGSVQHLKNKFSKGFTLVVKIKKQKINRPSNLIEFRNSTLVRPLGERIDTNNNNNNNMEDEDGLDEMQYGSSELLTGLKLYITNSFPGCVLQEEYQGLITYYIPNSCNLRWSSMFGMMESAKTKFNIEDYSLSQTSLESVFLSFAKHQNDQTKDKRK